MAANDENIATISMRCGVCGNEQFKIPDTKGDDDIVVCSNCQTEVGKYGQIKEALLKKAHETADDVKRQFLDEIRKSFNQ